MSKKKTTSRMSALPPKADICNATADVRFGPIAHIAGCPNVKLKSAEPLQPGAMLVCDSELAVRPIFRSGYRPSVTWQPQEEASQYLRGQRLAAQRRLQRYRSLYNLRSTRFR